MTDNPNIFGTAAGAYNQGVAGLANASNPLAPSMSMNSYLNPYRSLVLDDVIGRMVDQRDQDLNMVQGQASMQGAFGGARHGLVEAELMDRYHRNIGETAARTMQSGFDMAGNLGLQALSQNRIASQALMSAAPVGFNIGNASLNQQAQMGETQRVLAQQVLGQAGAQYDTYANYPMLMANQVMSSLRGNPLAGNSTTMTSGTSSGLTESKFNPGPLQFLQAGAGIMGGK
jgi:hypothetical protein